MTVPPPPDSIATSLGGFSRAALRVGWLVLVTFLLAAFAAGIPLRFTSLINGINPGNQVIYLDLDPALEAAALGLLGPQEMEALGSLGLSPQFYAAYVIAFELALALACTVVGAFIFWRRPDDWLTLWFSLVLVLLATTGLSLEVPTLASVWRGGVWVSIASGLLGMISNVHILFLSPDGRFVPRWTLPFSAGFTGGMLAMAAYVTFVYPAWGFQRIFGIVLLAFFAWFGLLGLGVLSQVYRYRRISGPVQRQQTKWQGIGLAAAALGIGVNAYFLFAATQQSGFQRLLTYLLRPPLVNLLLILLPISLGFSILRYRLWDIDLIIRRTLIYSSLTAALALVYFGSVVLLQGLVDAFLSLSTPVVTVLSTLAVAALFTPLRNRIQNFIDRRFYRRKYDAERTLAAFNAKLRDEVELERLSEAMLSVVDETLQPTQLSLWLREIDR